MIIAVFVFVFHCRSGIISDALGKKRLASQAYVDKLIGGNISNKIKSEDYVGLLDLEIDEDNCIVPAIGEYNWDYLNWFMDKNNISEVYIKGLRKSTGYVYDTIMEKNFKSNEPCDIFNISDRKCTAAGDLHLSNPIKGDTGEDATWIDYDGKLYSWCDLSTEDPKYSELCTEDGYSEIILERFALVLPDKRRMGDSELEKYAASLKYVKEKILDVGKNTDIRIKDRIKDDVYKKYEDLEIDGENRIVRAIGRDGYLELAKYMYDNNAEIHVKGHKKASGKKIDIRYPKITANSNITMLIGHPGKPDTEWAEFTLFAESKEYSGKLLAYCDFPLTCDSSYDEVILEKFRLIYPEARQLEEEELSKYAASLKYVKDSRVELRSSEWDELAFIEDVEIDENNRVPIAMTKDGFKKFDKYLTDNGYWVYVKGRKKLSGVMIDMVMTHPCSGDLYFENPEESNDNAWFSDFSTGYSGMLQARCELENSLCSKYPNKDYVYEEVILERFAVVNKDARILDNEGKAKYAASLKYVDKQVNETLYKYKDRYRLNDDLEYINKEKKEIRKLPIEEKEIDCKCERIEGEGEDAKFVNFEGVEKTAYIPFHNGTHLVGNTDSCKFDVMFYSDPNDIWEKTIDGGYIHEVYLDEGGGSTGNIFDESCQRKFFFICWNNVTGQMFFTASGGYTDYRCALKITLAEVDLPVVDRLALESEVRKYDDLTYDNNKIFTQKLPISKNDRNCSCYMSYYLDDEKNYADYDKTKYYNNIYKIDNIPFAKGAHLVGTTAEGCPFDVIFKEDYVLEDGNGNYYYEMEVDGNPNFGEEGQHGMSDKCGFLFIFLLWNNVTNDIFYYTRGNSVSDLLENKICPANISLAEADLPDRLALLSEIPRDNTNPELGGIVVNSESQAEDKAYSASYVEENFAKKPAEGKPFLTTDNISPDEGEAVTPSTALPTSLMAKKLAKEWFDGEYEIEN